MSATTPTDTAKAQGRSPLPSHTSFGVLRNDLFRSQETKYILENHQSVQRWSKFSQRWLFHAPRRPVGYYTNAKIDEIIANISYTICVLSCISVLCGCAVDDYRRRQKAAKVDIMLSAVTWDNCVLGIVSVCTIAMIVLNLARRYYRGLALHLALHLTKNEPFLPSRYWKNVILGGFFSSHHLFEVLINVPHMPPFFTASFQYVEPFIHWIFVTFCACTRLKLAAAPLPSLMNLAPSSPSSSFSACSNPHP